MATSDGGIPVRLFRHPARNSAKPPEAIVWPSHIRLPQCGEMLQTEGGIWWEVMQVTFGLGDYKVAMLVVESPATF